MDLQFNTQRVYADKGPFAGQVIRATTQEDGSIIFHDFSRRISGRIVKPQSDPETPYQWASLIMTAYDLGLFDSYVFPSEEPQFDPDMKTRLYRL